MSSEQLWGTGRRLLGVYFIVMAAIGLPGVLTSLGVDNEWPEPWMAWIIPVTILSQSVIGLAAGWWLLRDWAPVQPEFGGSSSPPVVPTALQLLGVYLLVTGAVGTAGEMMSLLLNRGLWLYQLGSFVREVLTLAAGLLLCARCSAIAEWLAAHRDHPAPLGAR